MNDFKMNATSALVAYALFVQMGRKPHPLTNRTYCGRVAAMYQATTGFEWWSGKYRSEHRNANFLNRVATAMAILDAERKGVDKTHETA